MNPSTRKRADPWSKLWTPIRRQKSSPFTLAGHNLSNGLALTSPAAAQRLEHRDLVLNQGGIG